MAPEFSGKRLDWTLAQLFPEYSRARLQAWIKAGHVCLDGNIVLSPKQSVSGAEQVLISAPCDACIEAMPEDMDLEIICEDDDILVLNKAAGCVVHPGAGVPNGTLLNGLLAHCPALAKVPRAGIVHRLDKDTTGLMVVAKTLIAQADLVRQLQERTVSRCYHAVACGHIHGTRTIDAPIGRHPKHRTKMAVVDNGKPAVTRIRSLEKFDNTSYVEALLETGRTHQIRVHMTHIGHPLVGDPVYGKNMNIDFDRQALHAKTLSFEHPISKETVTFESELPEDFAMLLQGLAESG